MIVIVLNYEYSENRVHGNKYMSEQKRLDFSSKESRGSEVDK